MLTATEREALDEAIHLPVYNPIREAIHAVVDRILAEHESEGWAFYAAEQERHAETTARLELMTREALLSREATEKTVRRLERLRDGVAYLHDVYAAPPNEPKCCSDCAANDISDELRRLLRDA